jgi:hypothetical protein
MTIRIESEDTYDVGDFSGVVQSNSAFIESPTGGTFYAKKPSYKGDTRVYALILSAGIPKPFVLQEGSVIYSDAGATTVVTGGNVYITHFGG